MRALSLSVFHCTTLALASLGSASSNLISFRSPLILNCSLVFSKYQQTSALGLASISLIFSLRRSVMNFIVPRSLSLTKSANPLKTTVRHEGKPSGLAVAICTYLDVGCLRCCASALFSSCFQSFWEATSLLSSFSPVSVAVVPISTKPCPSGFSALDSIAFRKKDLEADGANGVRLEVKCCCFQTLNRRAEQELFEYDKSIKTMPTNSAERRRCLGFGICLIFP
mmetsp:Transcript_1582/g.2466  ORF Transcript_1582/g.2466 Transcript_1582/m.2466 type:complete len:225 (+) Transcript_1582:468-1142(+)